MSLPDEPPCGPDPYWIEINDTWARFSDACLHELVLRAAEAHPDAVALVGADRRVTYAELVRESAVVAARLRARGIAREARVGICAARGVPLAVGILGILRTGAAYVPLDPSYPRDRLGYMLRDAELAALLVEDGHGSSLPAPDIPVIDLSAASSSGGLDFADGDDAVDPDQLAYVIYTSGSTGTPKGIALRHRGVVNNLTDLIASHGIGPGDSVLAISSPSFDMCVFEVLGPLIAGATVVFPGPAGAKDPAHWAESIRAHGVTIWNSAPPLLDMLVTFTENRPSLYPDSLRLALLGGDWIPVGLPDRLRSMAPEAVVVALGGATEASIHSIVYRVEEIDPAWSSIPYGKPMRNQRAYVLDEELRPTPVGVAGELHLGGVGLARGYHRAPGMTAARFIPDPVSGIAGERLYKTGDRARLMDDGNIELLGRMDHQVKIRGVRIDLTEIESVLKTHPNVARAVVVTMPDGAGGDRLVAHVVPADDRADVRAAGLAARQIERWRAIYDETYQRPEPDAPTGQDFSGWVSSYTGQRFADEELREAVDNAVDRILATEPERVLEVGCGTGLVLFRVAPMCAIYDAFDISPVVVKRLAATLADLPDHAHVRVRQGDALEALASVAPGSVDVVVVNSVVQHFPGLEYLEDVIAAAARAVRRGGWIYLGDLRALPLLRTFHVSTAVAKAADGADLESVRRRALRGLEGEKELFVHPGLFGEIAADNERLGWAAALLRRGATATEMNKFHFDVLLRAGASDAEDAMMTEHDGSAIDSPGSLERVLVDATGEAVLLSGIRNGRLSRELTLEDLVAEPGSAVDVEEALRQARQRTEPAPDPEALIRHASSLGWRAEAVWPASGDRSRFDLLACRGETLPTRVWRMARLAHSAATPDASAGAQLCNRPAGEPVGRRVVARLREHLASALPDVMIPSAFVFLDELPLTPNGKVDRTALPRPDDLRGAVAGVRQPRTDVERLVADTWERVMGVSPIGLDDDFFDLGGHSLTATQIVARLNDSLGIELPLRTLFEHPTVEGLSRELASRTGTGTAETAGRHSVTGGLAP